MSIASATNMNCALRLQPNPTWLGKVLDGVSGFVSEASKCVSILYFIQNVTAVA